MIDYQATVLALLTQSQLRLERLIGMQHSQSPPHAGTCSLFDPYLMTS